MTRHRIATRLGLCVIATGAVLAVSLVTVALAADSHPDIHGLWVKIKGPAENENTPPPLTPEGQKEFARTKAGILASDPDIDVGLRCVPTGFPRTAMNNLPIYIAEDPTLVAVLGEASQNLPQMIWMDQKHRDIWPTYMGDSVGHWDGDTLVVDVVGVKTTTFYNATGLPHSDAFHVIERFRLINGGKQLENRITFEDPKYFTKPWNVRATYDRSVTDRPIENVCDTTRLAP
jgi:hypothetical protein